jgi:hypothetical protein
MKIFNLIFLVFLFIGFLTIVSSIMCFFQLVFYSIKYKYRKGLKKILKSKEE